MLFGPDIFDRFGIEQLELQLGRQRHDGPDGPSPRAVNPMTKYGGKNTSSHSPVTKIILKL